MEFVSAIISPVIESLMFPIKRSISYMVYCREYARDMVNAMRQLDAVSQDVLNHMRANKRNNLVIPSRVPVWLEEVERIKNVAESIGYHDAGICSNFKTRYKLGRKAFNITKEIRYLMGENSCTVWTDAIIPLGRVDSFKPSIPTPIRDDGVDFESREKPFMEVLKALEPNNKSHMVALCGIGGVGKTVMMEKLKKVAEEKKMFDFIIKVVVGQKTDHFSIQRNVAAYLGRPLTETTKEERADRLRSYFEEISAGGRKKILVILDDVWETVDLKDIGLSIFSSRVEGFKVLLTSRDRHVCVMMGVEQHLIIDVKVLEEPEAQALFRYFVNGSDDVDLDPDFQKIGDDIVSRFHGLPLAIKTIAYSLRGQSKEIWLDVLSRLKQHGADETAHQVVKMTARQAIERSYNNIRNETKSVLLLCGLFPEDLNISAENLLRYGWGLKLFDDVDTISQARKRLNTCIEQLIYAKLLIGTHGVGWVRMHDPEVCAFVLSKLSEGDHASIVNHGDMSEWPAEDMSESCKRISLTCKGKCKFPREFKYPNLSLLKIFKGKCKFPRELILCSFPDHFNAPTTFECSVLNIAH